MEREEDFIKYLIQVARKECRIFFDFTGAPWPASCFQVKNIISYIKTAALWAAEYYVG